MLPKISRLIGEFEFSKIQIYVKRLFIVSTLIGVFGTVIYEVFTTELLALYLGETEIDLIEISKNIMWGALFYPFFVIMRSVIDAYYNKAYNSVSVTLSLLLFLVTYAISLEIEVALIFGLVTLSAVTMYRLFPIILKDFESHK